MGKRTQYCTKCRAIAAYEAYVDVYYCAACDQWVGERCHCEPKENCPYSLDKIPHFGKPSELTAWLRSKLQ